MHWSNKSEKLYVLFVVTHKLLLLILKNNQYNLTGNHNYYNI